MANYNLTQTGNEVQAYIDSIPVIDVTGTLSGSTITFGSNPYSQIAANYAADCSSIVRLTVGTAVYLLRVTQYDGTNYTAAEMSGAHNVVATIGSSSASATIDAGIDTTPTQGSDNLVKSGGVWEEITDINNRFYKKDTDIAVNATAANWALRGNGLCVSDSTSQMKKYLVTAGQYVYIKASKDNAGVFQWQSAASVPSSGTNTGLIGTPVNVETDGFFQVPTGATYLIVSSLKTNTTNIVMTAVPLENGKFSTGEELDKTGIAQQYEDSDKLVISSTLFTLLSEGFSYVSLVNITEQNYTLGSSGWYSGKHIAIPASNGETILLDLDKYGEQTEGDLGMYYAFVTNEYTPPTDTTTPIPYVTGTTRYRQPLGSAIEVFPPQGTAYIILSTVDGSGTSGEWSVYIKNTMPAIYPLLDSLIKDIYRNSFDTTPISVNIAKEYTFASAQKYGNVGGAIQTFNGPLWESTKIYPDMGIVSVSLKSPSSSASSLLQYVDDNDIIISREAVSPTANVYIEIPITFPEGASAAYISGTSGTTRINVVRSSYSHASVIGDMESLNTPVKSTLVGAINSLHSTNPMPCFRFKFLTWNVGHWAKGNSTSSAITAETYAETKAAFRKVINDFAPDIIGCCEYSSIFYNNETARDALFPQYQQAAVGSQSGYNCQALFSDIILTDTSQFNINNENRGYEAHIHVQGIDIIIAEVHLPWNTYEINRSAIEELIARYAEYEYVVIGGDFNFTSGYEEVLVGLLANAGYENSNWGYLGKILTSYNNIRASNYLDNIAVKGGHILKTEVLQNTPEGLDPDNPEPSDEELWDAVNLSDHFPMLSDIIFTL